MAKWIKYITANSTLNQGSIITVLRRQPDGQNVKMVQFIAAPNKETKYQSRMGWEIMSLDGADIYTEHPLGVTVSIVWAEE